MNINPKTGKPWINNYMQMMGTLQCNQNHEYVQLYRYFDMIGRLEGRTKAGYAMILHSHLAQVTCSRSPGMHFNIFMYIDNEKGHISNSKEMKEFMLSTGWMNCDAPHLLKIASHEVWWVVYKAMLEIGLISVTKGTLKVMFPIEGRFLPIPYAHVALLSRIKRDSVASKSVLSAMTMIPSQMRTNLEELPKEDLINEFIKLKTQNLNASKDNPVYQLLMDEIKSANPHQWGKNPLKNRETFLEKITEKIVENKVENNIENKIENNPQNNTQKNPSNNIENNFYDDTAGKSIENYTKEELREKYADIDVPGISSAQEVANKVQNTEPKEKKVFKTKELPPDKIHEFERTDKPSRKRSINVAARKPDENYKITIEDAVFYAEETTGTDLKKIQNKIQNKIPENISQNIPENIPQTEDQSDLFLPGDDIEDNIFDEYVEEDIMLPETAFDMFGLEITDTKSDPNIPDLPEILESQPKVIEDEFWG